MKQRHLAFGWLAAIASVLLLQPKPASAVPISTTIELNQVYAGSIPEGASPWLKAKFEQTGADTGNLTLISLLDGSDFVQGLSSPMAATGWSFYLNQSLASIDCTSGSCATRNVLFGDDYNSGPVPGLYNLAFGWKSTSRFEGTDTAVYGLTFADALSGNPFDANHSGWSSVAHVQGIGAPNFSCSGWIVSGTGTLSGNITPCGDPSTRIFVPEPGSLGMLGVGILLIGLLLGWRRRHHT